MGFNSAFKGLNSCCHDERKLRVERNKLDFGYAIFKKESQNARLEAISGLLKCDAV